MVTMNDAKQIIKCCLCGNHGSIVAHNRQFGYEGKILQCRQCSFAWMTPQYSTARLQDFYSRQYRHSRHESNDTRRSLGDLIRSRSQISFWKQYISPESRILEIGAGYGTNACNLFAAGYQNLVINEWDTEHLELNSAAPIAIDNRPLEKMGSKSFDFIILSHVLEHFNDIRSGIRLLKRLLSPNGKIFVEVPNGLNPQVCQTMEESYHYYFFTQASLVNLFAKHGFATLACATFGKTQLIGHLSAQQWETYRRIVEIDPGFDDIISLPPEHRDAYWIRAIFRTQNR